MSRSINPLTGRRLPVGAVTAPNHPIPYPDGVFGPGAGVFMAGHTGSTPSTTGVLPTATKRSHRLLYADDTLFPAILQHRLADIESGADVKYGTVNTADTPNVDRRTTKRHAALLDGVTAAALSPMLLKNVSRFLNADLKELLRMSDFIDVLQRRIGAMRLYNQLMSTLVQVRVQRLLEADELTYLPQDLVQVAIHKRDADFVRLMPSAAGTGGTGGAAATNTDAEPWYESSPEFEAFLANDVHQRYRVKTKEVVDEMQRVQRYFAARLAEFRDQAHMRSQMY
jgi:hypothetical protein